MADAMVEAEELDRYRERVRKWLEENLKRRPAGDVVELREPSGMVVGRGIVSCDAPAARAWCGGSPPAGVRNHHALVHRDHLTLES